VLDHESGLDLEEHYTDTHVYTKNRFYRANRDLGRV
jgi:hypothetical protein